jgi:hypothetical protein
MFSHCTGVGFNSLSGFGALGLTRVQESIPGGQGINDYYRKGTPFMWLAQQADSGFAFAIDPAADARNALALSLANAGYNVKVIFGERGGPLEVSGTQKIDRAKGFHIRDDIMRSARAAGFATLNGILFNVETPDSNWRVGSPGSDTTWGDRTPVAPVSLFDEFGLDLAGDPNYLGGTFKNLAIYAGIGLLAFFLITKATK